MVFSRRYNLINNALGWGVFVIALLSYWLTLEPTASYWDCGEFITQADKLEIGHPPGNPIFMLTARFFANFAFGDAARVALMVNAMSGLLSALTILLLFWTVTHLVRRLVMYSPRSNIATDGEPSLTQYLLIMGSGICGALAYAWSDTFWFSAVEAEVYAFSSFCTALVFWLILKWENHCDEPRADRYLILIAYVIGVSVAVHLLNLLCIPAIVLVYCFRRFPGMNVGKSLLALLVSFAIIVLVLYGLVPGFIKVAQWFELLCVNTFGMGFNSGTGLYALITLLVFIWALVELYRQQSAALIRASFFVATLLSGMLFIGSSLIIGILLACVLAYFLFFKWKKGLPVRWLNVAMWSICVIFVGYSSYALILIRSGAATPMNQNQPDNVFDLSAYLSREQYGETPLLYGQTFESSPMQEMTDEIDPRENLPAGYSPTHERTLVTKGKAEYAKGVKNAVPDNANEFLTQEQVDKVVTASKSGRPFYALYDYVAEYKMNPELNVLLPRIHSTAPGHAQAYELWVPSLRDAERVELSAWDPRTQTNVPLLSTQQAVNEAGEYYQPIETARKPSFWQNMQFFFNYQLNHMYWRYFLWNFAGRQNDVNNQYGEKDAGNWLTGIPVIDNARLGDQSLLPADLGKENKGHNVFYMLPLLLGIIGLLWQALRGRRGIEQFWVVFFLFFMTGIAIVLYLNQPPLQPRERDYAFAGSFYAFAIWIGMGVAGIYYGLKWLLERRQQKAGRPSENSESSENSQPSADAHKNLAWIAAAIGLLVPLQMVSQTWDDHDRSGRYAARDYAINYLESLEPNAIIFCNGDNDTFPLWYAQEVEGVRPDVKIINLSYLASEWYANQQRLQTYSAMPVEFTAKPEDYAYGRRSVTYITRVTDRTTPTPLVTALKEIYGPDAIDRGYNLPIALHSNTYIPVDSAAVVKSGLVSPEEAKLLEPMIPVQLSSMSLGKLLMLDIIATNAQNGWKRPIYWAMTVGSDQYSQFLPYLRQTGMALQLVPYQANQKVNTRLAYPIIMNKYRWGGAENGKAYFDETAGRMLSGVRMTVLDLANSLTQQGDFKKALEVVRTYEKNLGDGVRPANFQDVYTLGTVYCVIGDETHDKKLTEHGLRILADGLKRYATNVKYMLDLGQRYGFYEATGQDGTVTVQVNVMTTPENQAILYSYYVMVQAYETYAGTPATLKLLKGFGISEKLLNQLRKYYEDSITPRAVNAGGVPADGYVAEIGKWIEIVSVMQEKSPEEYRNSAPEELEIDSAFAIVLAEFLQSGGTEEMLSPYAEKLEKIDLDRSMNLAKAYREAHPELGQ
ncbi:MAG: DUF2723 domain-containing protein [Bacteroidales bacterium]|nr:DUF2723 domain-containing protein [Bacteroidales bacterium]